MGRFKKIEDWYAVQFDVETAIKVSDHILDVMKHIADTQTEYTKLFY